jgi:enamine deaminase RidA (YjgF/YER057c/UK114 family)
MSTELIFDPNGPVPKGYADGRIGRGPVLHIAGQVGWKNGVFEAKDLVGQFSQALETSSSCSPPRTATSTTSPR